MTVEEIKLNDKVEETTTDWEAYVRSEVAGILETFLPFSNSGNVGISYTYAAEGETESGEPIYSDKQVIGVNVLLNFNFEEQIDKPT